MSLLTNMVRNAKAAVTGRKMPSRKGRGKWFEHDHEAAMYVARAESQDFPSEVIHRAKITVLDTLGVMAAGLSDPRTMKMVSGFVESEADGSSSVLGQDKKVSSSSAAFLNGCLAQVYDFNDGHRLGAANKGSPHPARVVVPAALAQAEESKSSGLELLESVVVSYDVAVKTTKTGKIPKSCFYAAAAAVSRLRKFDYKTTQSAMGLSGHFSASKYGSVENQIDTNYLMNGYRARSGVEAARLAHLGMVGPSIFSEGRPSRSMLQAGYGSEFEIMTSYIKPYPSCRMTHAAIDGVTELVQAYSLNSEDILRIKIVQPKRGMYVARKIPENNTDVKTLQMNIYFTVACAVVNGEFGIDSLTREPLLSEEILETMDKIEVSSSDSFDKIYPLYGRPSQISIHTKHNGILELSIKEPWGGISNPMKDEDIKNKFLRNMARVYTSEDSVKIMNLVLNLDKEEDVSNISQILRKRLAPKW